MFKQQLIRYNYFLTKTVPKNWEIGIDIYTLICIKWITNKNLLYKKINKILK